MIDSDDFSSLSYSPYDTTNNGHFDSSNSNHGTTELYKKKKSFDIDVNNNNSNNNNNNITRRDIQGRSLLHYFAFNGDLENAKKLFSFNFPVDLTDESLNSALHVASEYGQATLVAFLIEQQALVNRQNIGGKTALHLAVESDQKECVDILLSYGANPNIKDLEGASPLHYSVANGFLDISQSLLKHGAFANIKDYSKETPLFWAIRESKADQVELLIKNGANLNIKNDDGETPLDLAQEFDEDEISILIQRALNPSATYLTNTFPSSFSSIGLPSVILQNKSQPVNFVNPQKGMEQQQQQLLENRPQSL